ncbi:MAG: tetratricopeptide repeat protein [Rariglobus sp.]
MKLFLSACIALVAVSPLCAQRYILKDGRALNASDVALSGSNLVRSMAGGGAEISYPLAQVARLDWPEPAEIEEARLLVAAGKGAEGEAKIVPIYNQFAPFSKVPGSWWSSAALIRARAFLDQKKNDEAERAARELMSGSTDVETVTAAQLIMARIQMLQDKADIADAMLDEIMRKDASSEIEARAAILRGDIAYGRKEFEKALEFYLQVPAFYGTEEAVMPVALLGSARSYRGYGDPARAERAFLDIIVTYPDSAEAAAAKTESASL